MLKYRVVKFHLRETFQNLHRAALLSTSLSKPQSQEENHADQDYQVDKHMDEAVNYGQEHQIREKGKFGRAFILSLEIKISTVYYPNKEYAFERKLSY